MNREKVEAQIEARGFASGADQRMLREVEHRERLAALDWQTPIRKGMNDAFRPIVEALERILDKIGPKGYLALWIVVTVPFLALFIFKLSQL